MHIKTLAVTAALAGSLSIAIVPRAAAQDDRFADVEIETTQVRDHVYMLMGRGGNIGVSAGEDGVFLIDDQYAPLTDKINTAIDAIDKGSVRFVVNTHWHGDHTGGNENFGKAGSLIVAHDNVRERMSTKQVLNFGGNQREVPASPDVALPVVTFNDTVTFHINGDTLEVFHVPNGHTDGDAIILFHEANVVHMGDIMFNKMYPFIDLSSGGSVQGMIDGVEQVLERIGPETKVIPGHGPLTDKAGLQRYHAMLTSIRDNVQTLIDQGKSQSEVIAAKPTAEFDEDWGGGFIKADSFAKTVYASLTE